MANTANELKKDRNFIPKNCIEGIKKTLDFESMKLFEPLSLGFTELKNRFVMGSMHTGLEDSLKNLPKLTEYFVERARGGVGLIITGGYSPNLLGRLTPNGGSFKSKSWARAHQSLTKAVHENGSKICLQLLHAGRYSFHPLSVAPSRIKSPITPFTPFAMPGFLVKWTIQDFAKAAENAKLAGYDGVEIMGSEGYLIHQFISARTNHRSDEFGGSFENRMRFPLEIVKETRKRVGAEFIIIFRLSLLDLVEGGSTFEEVVQLAKELRRAGVTIINSGIGWHEARIPTIGSMVPKAAFTGITAKLRAAVKMPIIATNRINDPSTAEDVLSRGDADLISMARPFLADPAFVNKTKAGHPEQINPCIACNQACLDHIFEGKHASCLVNPSACEETEWKTSSTPASKKYAVIGAGPAGMNAALVLLRAGHQVTLFEKEKTLGGQFKLASQVPGKAEYLSSIEFWESEIKRLGGKLSLGRTIKGAFEIKGFDEVIIATGVKPRKPSIPGINLPHVYSYNDLLSGKVAPKHIMVIIGAGGIGVDVATYILNRDSKMDYDPKEFFKHWGIDPNQRSGLTPGFKAERTRLSVTVLQRSQGGMGRGLGKTTGWIHRLDLKRTGVRYLNNLSYEEITNEGVRVKFKDGKTKLVPAQQVFICAGQESENSLVKICEDAKIPYRVIGGAKLAGELDAKRAIRDAWELTRTELR
jgi:2,4-dienoyl-CoA reductase (NADPH2)